MKRIGNLFNKIVNIDNLKLADQKARKGKRKSFGVKLHDRNREDNIVNLYYILKNKEYRTSQYTTFSLKEYDKVREIYRLPYYPDRIVHHAIMNILEPIFYSMFTKDTYSSIKKKGIHKALRNLTTSLRGGGQLTV